MTIDFQQLRQQVIEIGNRSPEKAKRITALRDKARDLFTTYSQQNEWLTNRVQQVVERYDRSVRSAKPADLSHREPEPLTARVPTPEMPGKATVLAADGSQIMPDRHAEVLYALINLGVIRMRYGTSTAPEISIDSKLYDGDQLYTETGQVSEARLALMRDLYERKILSEFSNGERKPVVSFTDGPIELWGARDGQDSTAYQQTLASYVAVLEELRQKKIITAGYVDKPGANLVIRLLELASMEDNELPDTRRTFPLRGASDFWLFSNLLRPGERSAIFGIQSISANFYPGELALNFFYLNVGTQGNPWIARVEVPAWVIAKQEDLDNLHAVLIDQCRIMGQRPYPYLLHRAHETALVTRVEKDQVTAMINGELLKRGLSGPGISQKQYMKNLSSRGRYLS